MIEEVFPVVDVPVIYAIYIRQESFVHLQRSKRTVVGLDVIKAFINVHACVSSNVSMPVHVDS